MVKPDYIIGIVASLLDTSIKE